MMRAAWDELGPADEEYKEPVHLVAFVGEQG
jgi:hypothetical protein